MSSISCSRETWLKTATNPKETFERSTKWMDGLPQKKCMPWVAHSNLAPSTTIAMTTFYLVKPLVLLDMINNDKF